MAEIKSIDKNTVHQICSGQVILDLSIAIKELVENSLDAGATSVEVRLKEYGLEQVEVIDNGEGVEEKQFAALTLKHHTSKLKDFSDLSTVGTFGFRGEALSSLCALCDVTICTKHVKSSVGYKIEYDHNGHVTTKVRVARQTGTTVALRNIFSTLPVRHKEFKKNIRKEYTKVLSLLSAYCIISTSTKLSCYNQTGKSKKGVVLGTQGVDSIKQNITSVYGAKQLQTLLEFKQEPPSPEICDEYHLKSDEAHRLSLHYTVSGFVSNAVHGNGRSSPDRQFYFVNSRPIDLPRLAKVINEVYHMHNRHQYPFVVLNIEMKRDNVDVNVTPDKRQVFLQNEKVLLALVKSSLVKLYTCGGMHVVGPVVQSTLTTVFPRKMNDKEDHNIESDCGLIVPSKLQQVDAPSSNSNDSAIMQSMRCSPKIGSARIGNKSAVGILDKFRRGNNDSAVMSPSPRKRSADHALQSNSSITVSKQPKLDTFLLNSNNNDIFERNVTQFDSIKTISNSDDVKIEFVTTSKHDNSAASSGDVIEIDSPTREDDRAHLSHGSIEEHESFTDNLASSSSTRDDGNQPHFILDSPNSDSDENTAIHDIRVSMSYLKRIYAAKKLNCATKRDDPMLFRAKIEPGQNTNAENELSRNLSKESFKQMTPLGQFNLGFIIARYKNDLFIVDQHASDEIYNYETLQQTTEMLTQNLVVPQKLDLTPADQIVLMDNLHIFQRNGFDFITKDNENSSSPAIFLVKIPMSKNWEFGAGDIDELIFMLSDAPGVMCRPSRIQQMFASRACRKSIMIGTAMNKKDMSRLINHMSEINHPWNCPHGRPTMRHLIDISKISTDLSLK